MDSCEVIERRSAPAVKRRLEKREESIFLVVESVVAASLRLPVATLHAHTRCPAPVAFARQVAMYIAHVWRKHSLSDVGRHFGRDRTTVSHACEVIEDRREDPDVDRLLTSMEATVDVWLDFQGWLGSAQ
jgi:chromosomal replication initiation ATPase DnaA